MKSQTRGIGAVDLLLKARADHKTIPCLPSKQHPKDLLEAYKFQEMLVQRLPENAGGTIGYKVACTNKLAQDLLSVNEPFYGRLLSQTSFLDGAQLASRNFFFRCIEAEFSFEIAEDLPMRAVEPGEISTYVQSILPSIEIVDSRFVDWLKIDAHSHIVDNACHGAWVRGKACTDWRHLDLATEQVKLIVNGQIKREGSGEAVLGNPLNVLAWLANSLYKNGTQLKAGEFVSTGITTDVYFAEAKDKIRADFGAIGQVEVSFSP
jgi:2-keto-4-pentenoate hydratase